MVDTTLLTTTRNDTAPNFSTDPSVWNSVASIVGFRGDDLTTGTGTDPRTITTTYPG